MRTVWDIIKSPVITEKALVAKEESQDTGQLLTFRVDRRATKPEIKSAVESIFQVKVDHVRTINFMGKTARRGRFEGRKPSWKKAYVTLRQGDEMGRFLLGSTVVVLFPRNTLRFNPEWSPQRAIRLGEKMGEAAGEGPFPVAGTCP